ncbi:hypothetical protein K8R33_04250 [archaeon]|nr:hypothetical protein [archaeon]
MTDITEKIQTQETTSLKNFIREFREAKERRKPGKMIAILDKYQHIPQARQIRTEVRKKMGLYQRIANADGGAFQPADEIISKHGEGNYTPSRRSGVNYPSTGQVNTGKRNT